MAYKLLISQTGKLPDTRTLHLTITLLKQRGDYFLYVKPNIDKMIEGQLLKAVNAEEQVYFDGSMWGRGSTIDPTKSFLYVTSAAGSVRESESKIGLGVEVTSVFELIGEHSNTIAVYILLNLLIITAIGFFRLVNLTLKPLERIVRTSESYQESVSSPFGVTERKSEFGRLSSALNNMVFNIETDREKLRKAVESLELANQELHSTQEEMVRTEKFASVGRLSAGFAHEIGNPIGIIQGYVELLQDKGLSEEERIQFGKRAQKELERIDNLISQLLNFARGSERKPEIVRLKELFDELLEILNIELDKAGVNLLSDIHGDPTVKADPEALKQVFLNCLLNSLDAIGDLVEDRGKNIYLKIRTINKSEQNIVNVEIKDTGCGIDATFLNTIFDPFFTTKAPGKGTGLGLFVSHSIIEMYGGNIRLESEPGEWTLVTIELPAYESN